MLYVIIYMTGFQSDFSTWDSVTGKRPVLQQTWEQTPLANQWDHPTLGQNRVFFTSTIFFFFYFCFLVTVKCNSVLFMSVSVFSTLEQRILNMEARHHAELGWIKGERTELQRLLASQSSSIQSLELNLEQVVTNNSALYREQLQMYSTINDLLKLCSKNKGTKIGETNCVLHMTFRGNKQDCLKIFYQNATKWMYTQERMLISYKNKP